MATGMVTTARGVILNLDELIAKGAQPIGKPEKSTRTNAGYNPAENTKPQVRGFVPTGGDATPPVMDQDEPVMGDVEMKSSFTNDGKAVTLNDLTGVKVTKSATPKAKVNKPISAAKDDAELGELLGKLKKPKK